MENIQNVNLTGTIYSGRVDTVTESKNNNKYDEGIIDCYKYDPELRLVFKLEDMKVYVYAQNTNDAEAVKTAELIYETFNFYNTGIRECESNAIYKKLTEQMDLLYTVLEEYVKAPGSKDIQNKLKALLRRESAFAVFKRNYIRDHLKKYPQLEVYLQ